MDQLKRLVQQIVANPLLKVFMWILLVAVLGGTIVLFLELRAGSGKIGTITEAVWWAIVTMTTVGYGDYTPQGLGGRTIAVVIMFIGISLTSFLTGTIASIIVARKLRANQGLLPIKVKDHIIICGWHHKIDSILNVLLNSDIDSGCQVVLINEESEDKMQAVKNEFGYTRLKYIRGEFVREHILKQANIESAQAVIILPTESHTGIVSDDRTILATLTIKNIMPDIKIVAYAHDHASIPHLKRANADNVVLADNFGSFLMVSHILNPGIPQAADMLLDARSEHHFRKEDIPAEFVGKTFNELLQYFRSNQGWIVIGLYTEEEQADFSSFLSADVSQLDAFIERKLIEAGKGHRDGQSISVVVNPPDDHVITDAEGAIIIP
ncbi:potassium channel family protein [Candidatus Neomarinimicrobiota bacterium]